VDGTYRAPAAIDEAYVERVLNALYHVEGDAVRLMIDARGMSPEAERLLRSLYTQESVQPVLDSYRSEAAAGFPTARSPLGDVTIDVDRLFTATPSCIFASGRRDFSRANTVQVDPNLVDFVWLVPAEPGQTANPTPWRIQRQTYRTDGLEERDQCAA
jgi:hypothetical protein